MERVGRSVRGGEGDAAGVVVPLVSIPLTEATWNRVTSRGRSAERWGEWAVIGVTLLLVGVLLAGIRHAVATSPVVPATAGRMVFAPPIR